MNIKYLNESFKRLYEEAIDQEPVQSSIQSELRTQLEDALMRLQFKGATNIKEYEIAFQQAIENVFPDKAWWEVTDCNIFFSLFETRSPELTLEQIITQLKPEYKGAVEENLEEFLDADINIGAPNVSIGAPSVPGLGEGIIADVGGSIAGFLGGTAEGNTNESLNESTLSISDFINDLKDTYAEDVAETGDDNYDCDIMSDNYDSHIEVLKDIANQYDQEFDNLTHTISSKIDTMVSKKFTYKQIIDTLIDECRNESLKEQLEECLNRLNEAQISDEDKRDSDLIRSMMAKIEKRSNARFTPEEQAVLDKYGIKRNPYQKDLEVAGRPLESPVDSKNYDNNYYGYNNGNHGKINYADRARKLPQRQSSQVYGDHAGTRYISGNDWVNKHTGPKPTLNPNKPNYRRRNDYKTTLQSAERDEINTKMHQPIDDMQRALHDRRYHQREVDQSQSKYDQAAAAAKKTYDDSMRRAQSYLDDAQPGGYHYDRVQRAQGEVDTLLKRKPKKD